MRRLLRDERGFTLVATMGALMVIVLMTAATFSAIDGDLAQGEDDRRDKQALAAAQAGVAEYAYQLVADNAYWARCTDVPAGDAVNQRWDGQGADPRRWRALPASQAEYTIELLPARGTRCVTGSGSDLEAAQRSMIGPDGTFRIRVTGRSSRTSADRRSLVATFRSAKFLDYLYFTEYETQDPVLYDREAYAPSYQKRQRPPGEGGRDVRAWAEQECATRHFYEGRGAQQWAGEGFYDPDGAGPRPAGWNPWPYRYACGEIRFVDGDEMQGPLHTNDQILVCGRPSFGRSPEDQIEVADPPRAIRPGEDELLLGWRADCGGSAPRVNAASDPDPDPKLGTWRPHSAVLDLPPSNTGLRLKALPQNRFAGQTRIRMSGSMMHVWGEREDGTVLDGAALPLPADGVVHVSNSSRPDRPCAVQYDPERPGPSPSQAGCGNLLLDGGPYAANVTLSAENDILVRGNVTRAGDRMLGLIANNLVRVDHPLTTEAGCADEPAGARRDVTIEAAILALNHSFLVDRFWCGTSRGHLRIRGSIGQMFRGPVGTSGGENGRTGYLKDYRYDDRLRFRSPPHFLDPVQSAWRIISQVEQTPAT